MSIFLTKRKHRPDACLWTRAGEAPLVSGSAFCYCIAMRDLDPHTIKPCLSCGGTVSQQRRSLGWCTESFGACGGDNRDHAHSHTSGARPYGMLHTVGGAEAAPSRCINAACPLYGAGSGVPKKAAPPRRGVPQGRCCSAFVVFFVILREVAIPGADSGPLGDGPLF